MKMETKAGISKGKTIEKTVVTCDWKYVGEVTPRLKQLFLVLLKDGKGNNGGSEKWKPNGNLKTSR